RAARGDARRDRSPQEVARRRPWLPRRPPAHQADRGLRRCARAARSPWAAAAPDTSIRQSLALAPRPGTRYWWSSSLPAYSPARTSARTAARRLSRPPGSAGALRPARLPGMLLDDERVVVVDAVGERADDRAPVEEERRGGVDPDPRPGLDVLADARARGRVVQAGAERLHVEPELACVAEEALALEVLVVLEQDVVVLPEAVLPSRTLCRAR